VEGVLELETVGRREVPVSAAGVGEVGGVVAQGDVDVDVGAVAESDALRGRSTMVSEDVLGLEREAGDVGGAGCVAAAGLAAELEGVVADVDAEGSVVAVDVELEGDGLRGFTG